MSLRFCPESKHAVRKGIRALLNTVVGDKYSIII